MQNYKCKLVTRELGDILDRKTIFITHNQENDILTIWDIKDENKSLLTIHDAKVFLNDLIKIKGYVTKGFNSFIRVEIYIESI